MGELTGKVAIVTGGSAGSGVPPPERSQRRRRPSLRHETPRILERGGRSIVNCSTVAGLVGLAYSPAHSAAKHGVVGLTRTAALEHAEQGIRVNAVCPGGIDTEMLGRVRRWFAGDTAVLRAQPVGLGRPEEIADTVWVVVLGPIWSCHRSGHRRRRRIRTPADPDMDLAAGHRDAVADAMIG